jgi:geranylgeranyl pyrophosphate synthase
VTAIQQVLRDTGAVAEVEASIEALAASAIDALTSIDVTDGARAELDALARFVAWRDA